MKQSELKEIPTKGFDKKWWQKHRSRKASASGVGKALDAWNAAGVPPQGKLAKLTKGTEMEAAFAACEQLKKALATAGSKTKGKAKDTYEGIQSYETERKKHEKALVQLYEQKKTACLKQRTEFASRTGTRLSQDKKDTASIKDIVKSVADMEKLADVAIKAGNVNEADRYLAQAQKLLKTARSHLESIHNRHEANRDWESKQKSGTYNENNVGIMPKDKLRKRSGDLLRVATKNIYDCSSERDVAEAKVAEIEDHVQAISDLKTRGNLSLNDWLAKAEQIRKETAELVDENANVGAAYCLRNALGVLKDLQSFLPEEQLTRRQLGGAQQSRVGVTHQVSRLPSALTQMGKLVKQKNRIPSEFQKHDTIKPLIDAINKNARKAADIAKKMKQVEALADKTLKEIQSKTIID